MRLFFLFIVASFLSKYASAQNTDRAGGSDQVEISNSGVYSGSIPLVSVVAGNLTYPVALNYQARAFAVQEIASEVGLGWRLEGLSFISRTINGKPDSFQGNIDPDRDEFKVTIGAKTFKIHFDDQSQPIIFNNEPYSIKKYPSHNLDFWSITDDMGVEYIFGNTVSSVETESFIERTVVDSLINKLPPNSRHKNWPAFILSSMTDSVRFERSTTRYENIPMTWYLTKIVSPDQSAINFAYSKDSNPVDEDYYNISYTVSEMVELKYRDGFYFAGIPFVKRGTSSTNRYIKNRFFTTSNHRVTKSWLREISSPVCLVQFSYSYRSDLAGGKNIQKITVSNRRETLQTFDFSYYYSTSQGPSQDPIYALSFGSVLSADKKLAESKRLMLKKVVVNGAETLVDCEYDATILPPRYSQHFDDFGYFRTNNNTHDIRDEKYGYHVSSDTLKSNVPYLSTFYTTKSPVFAQTKANSLFSLKNTGSGKIFFEYEQNETLVDTNEYIIGGGLRVNKIVRDYLTMRDTVKFEFSDNYQYSILPVYHRGLSYRGQMPNALGQVINGQLFSYNEAQGEITQIHSNYMLKYDRFGVGNTQMYSNQNLGNAVMLGFSLYKGTRWKNSGGWASAALVSTNSMSIMKGDRTPSYETVKIIYPNNSYTLRTYTGYKNFADAANIAYFSKVGQADRLAIQTDNRFKGTSDFSALRHHLLGESHFDSLDNIVSRYSYKYRVILDKTINSQFIEPINYEGMLTYDVVKRYDSKVYNFFLRIDSLMTTEFLHNSNAVDSVSMLSTFNYSTQYPWLVKSQRTVGFNGVEQKRIMTYPGDYSSYPLISQMLTKNLINYPIETITVNDGKVVNGTYNTYTSSNNVIFNDQIFQLRLDVGIPEPQFALGGTDTRYAKAMERSIDGYGNITEEVSPEGVKVTTIWGYAGQYPIAKIHNASYAEVLAVWGGVQRLQ